MEKNSSLIKTKKNFLLNKQNYYGKNCLVKVDKKLVNMVRKI